ncbi:MAG: heme o synthase [Cyanobacteria bacterium J06635_15]
MTAWSPVRHHESFGQVLKSYWQLTKPRIIPLLLIETAGSMWIAAKGHVDPMLLIITLLSGALAAASAQVINCVYDRDIDYDMERTRHRPLPSGRVKVRDALVFSAILAIASFSLQTWVANLLSACLAMVGIVLYVGVYTHWLKRSSTQNIVIGGAAGAIPPLVGWAAVTGHLSWPAWVIFAIVFVWTPPHFWGLAMVIQDDYAKVGIPMLPVVVGNEKTAQQILVYTLLLLPITLLLVYPLGVSGGVYAIFAIALGYVFLKKAWLLNQTPADKDLSKSLFKYSILYMMLLSAGMVVDQLPWMQQLNFTLGEQLNILLTAIPMISVILG